MLFPLPCDLNGKKEEGMFFLPFLYLDFLPRLTAARIELKADGRCFFCPFTCLRFTKEQVEEVVTILKKRE
jgi:hypothetical protein